MKNRSFKLTLVAALAVTAIGGLSMVALGAEDGADAPDSAEGPDVAITGSALVTASDVALAFTGEGQVTETEIEDEESFYEVEVTLADGSQIDVQLDEAFNVLGTD